MGYGYLAVLLGNLCLDERVKQHVRQRLPGATLRPLAAAVSEFLQFHRKVDLQLQSSQGDGTDGTDGFTERLQALLDALDRA